MNENPLFKRSYHNGPEVSGAANATAQPSVIFLVPEPVEGWSLSYSKGIEFVVVD